MLVLLHSPVGLHFRGVQGGMEGTSLNQHQTSAVGRCTVHQEVSVVRLLSCDGSDCRHHTGVRTSDVTLQLKWSEPADPLMYMYIVPCW